MCGYFATGASPAAAGTVCDLTAVASCSVTGLNTGLFYVNEVHPSGTGVIDSFLRVQQKGYEAGFNTSGRPINLDQIDATNSKTDKNFTRDLLLTEVSTKDINGHLYREFFLDINEQNSNVGPLLTLDQLEIYVSNTASLTSYSNSNNQYQATKGNDEKGALAGATKIFDLDTATSDNMVQLTYSLLGKGSGSSDMTFYLDNDLFGSYKYVYLFSQFGDNKNVANKYESGAGFEEWFVKQGSTTTQSSVPEPATLLLLGTGLVAAVRKRSRKSVA